MSWQEGSVLLQSIKGDMDSYRRHSRIVAEIIKERVPVVEKAAIDEFNVDLSGMDRFYGCTCDREKHPAIKARVGGYCWGR